MSGDSLAVVHNSERVCFVSSVLSIHRQPNVDVWKDAYGFGCVHRVFDEFPYRGEDSPSWVSEASDFPIAVEEVRGADFLEGL